MKILFVCQGNVCRSQMAEALFNSHSAGRHTSSSVGTHVVTSEKNREGQRLSDIAYAKDTLRVLHEMGFDVSENVRNQLTAQHASAADKIIVMVEPTTVPVYLRDNPKVTYWPVEDPYLHSLEFTRGTRDQIHAYVRELLTQLG